RADSNSAEMPTPSTGSDARSMPAESSGKPPPDGASRAGEAAAAGRVDQAEEVLAVGHAVAVVVHPVGAVGRGLEAAGAGRVAEQADEVVAVHHAVAVVIDAVVAVLGAHAAAAATTAAAAAAGGIRLALADVEAVDQVVAVVVRAVVAHLAAAAAARRVGGAAAGVVAVGGAVAVVV